jgi:hypothetical protein
MVIRDRGLHAPRQFLAYTPEKLEFALVDVLQADLGQAASLRAPERRTDKKGCPDSAAADQGQFHSLLRRSDRGIATGYNQLCQCETEPFSRFPLPIAGVVSGACRRSEKRLGPCLRSGRVQCK